MADAPKSLDTEYAGYRFRSRLEARWAVALDSLGVDWEYEPQTLQIGKRIDCDDIPDDGYAYLPDFWLPELSLWVDVKATMTDEQGIRLLNTAAYLSNPGDWGCGGGNDMAILPRIPRLGETVPPFILHMHKGLLQAAGFHSFVTRDGCYGDVHPVHLCWDVDDDLRGAASRVCRLISEPMLDSYPGSPLSQALAKARRARFEWGQHPVPPAR